MDEEMWVENAREMSLKGLADLAAKVWHAVDRDGFCSRAEDDFERRQLFISETRATYRLDGWLDAEGGAARSTRRRWVSALPDFAIGAL